MSHHESTIEVPVAPAVAFAHLADLAAASTWDPTIVESSRIVDGPNDGPVGEGARFRAVVAFFGRRIELEQVIERYDRPVSLVVAGRNKNVESRTTYRIDERDGGSRITAVSDLNLKGPLRLLDKGLQVTYTNMGDRTADALKAALER